MPPSHTVAIIPARYGSTRFPGKPLALLGGKPMIVWVVERVSQVKAFDQVVVATDDIRILDCVTQAGYHALMTGEHHTCGTNRIWEALGLLSHSPNYVEPAYVFNIQGDEPFIDPGCLEEAVRRLQHNNEDGNDPDTPSSNRPSRLASDIITLKTPLGSTEERLNPNVVKVVTNQADRALYFSRSPIPYSREEAWPNECPFGYGHVGVYGFRLDSLKRFVQHPPSPLEQLEQLEQLRALDMGMSIDVMTITKAPKGIDTPEDLILMETLLANHEQPC